MTGRRGEETRGRGDRMSDKDMATRVFLSGSRDGQSEGAHGSGEPKD